jgi:hypothetical protein
MKSNLNKLLFVFLAITIFYSCKKKKEVEPPIVTIEPQIKPDKINSYFDVYNAYYYQDNNFLLWRVSVSCGLNETYADNDSIRYSSLGLDYGNVKMNDSILNSGSVNNIGFVYGLFAEFPKSSFSKPTKWEVQGKDGNKGFSYIDNTAYPMFNGLKSLPDTIYMYSDNRIKLDNVAATDIIEVTIITATSRYHGYTETKTVTATQNYIDFKRYDLAQLATQDVVSVKIDIKLSKDNYKKIGDRLINFRTSCSFLSHDIPVKY